MFVRDTPNPAMTSPTNTKENEESQLLMKKECQNLLTQIDRLKLSREMWDMRLQNIIHLVRWHYIIFEKGPADSYENRLSFTRDSVLLISKTVNECRN